MCRNYVRMDGWVQDDVLTTWHLHLAFSWETIPSEYKMGNLIGYICPGMKQMCNVEISQTPTQWNSKCSKLFNLKADGGTTNKKVHNQRVGKKRKRQANSCKSDKRTAKKAQKEHEKRTLPSAHTAWLLRTRTHGGVCSSEPMWCLGARSILQHADLAKDNGWRLCLKTFMPYHARHYAENMHSM